MFSGLPQKMFIYWGGYIELGGVEMVLAVKSAVKKEIKKLNKKARISGDFWKALDERIKWKIKRAVQRAKANKRMTVRGCDL